MWFWAEFSLRVLRHEKNATRACSKHTKTRYSWSGSLNWDSMRSTFKEMTFAYSKTKDCFAHFKKASAKLQISTITEKCRNHLYFITLMKDNQSNNSYEIVLLLALWSRYTKWKTKQKKVPLWLKYNFKKKFFLW